MREKILGFANLFLGALAISVVILGWYAQDKPTWLLIAWVILLAIWVCLAVAMIWVTLLTRKERQ